MPDLDIPVETDLSGNWWRHYSKEISHPFDTRSAPPWRIVYYPNIKSYQECMTEAGYERYALEFKNFPLSDDRGFSLPVCPKLYMASWFI